MALPAPGTALAGAILYALLLAQAAAAQTAAPASLPPPVETPAAGNRAGENAVRGASDAFGTVIGREEIGLYAADNIRGFSPVVAGNVRIEGLYFDPVIFPSDRISGATSIRIGPSALGSPFPAPTGIVDLSLRVPGRERAGSALASLDSFGSHIAELDLALPLSSRFSLGLGAMISRERFINAAHDDKYEGALIARWRATDALTLTPFLSLAVTPRDDVGPIFLPAGDMLPPDPPRRRFIGPAWARRRDTELNAGLIADWALAQGWQLKAGLFRSSVAFPTNFSNLMEAVGSDGHARQTVLADPRLFFVSNSGEVRLTRSLADGPRSHQLHLALRGRQAFRSFGGSDSIDLGDTTIGTPSRAPLPAFRFGAQEEDRVRQWTGAVGYEGNWQGVGTLSLGLQKSDYAKRIGLPGFKTAVDAAPWLGNANAAIRLGQGTEIYGGFVTGLEESGIAPANAVNRNEALPAIITRQVDAGARQTLGDLTLVAGVFRLAKPYFNLDASGRFGPLGEVVSRGVEASIAGPITPSLSIVAGGVFSAPRVAGEAVALGVSGPLPVGAVRRTLSLSADWRPHFAPGLSFDIALFANSSTVATVNNAVHIPAQTFIDLGARYGFRLAGRDAVLRAQIFNAGGVNGVYLEGAGAYGMLDGRVAQLYLTMDF
ncbi:TonB-dependent receptor [Sandarakinorhabdus cyanobacteriorum]|uniref:TonB-dependent receptor n=1 Tax=Sandarakinorhabdus cyanobacteriorum TaxID=1981098 RepID=A0A255YB92_9SPHN|nr:TonB-dependent receptor [Sandarakinorhabdus cyanobacteriorum]OYQ26507.1 TonB-dependent receptor [Sandarakinorhabdus cyanobacteriorum]